MAQTIKLKRGTTTPTTSNLVSGEVAIDTSAQKLYINDGGTIKEVGGGGGGITYSVKTSAYTASAGDGIIADSSGGAFTITLPATPSAGDVVSIVDGAAWATNNVTVARNGSTIEGAAENLTLDVSGLALDLIYDGSTWQLYPLSGTTTAESDTLATVTARGASTTSNITVGNTLAVGGGSGAPNVNLNAASSQAATVAWRQNNVTRYTMQMLLSGAGWYWGAYDSAGANFKAAGTYTYGTAATNDSGFTFNAGQFVFKNYNDTSTYLYINSSGGVGIGTTTIQSGFSVRKGSTAVPAAGSADSCAQFGNSIDHKYGLQIGAIASGKGYIQAQRSDGTATTYDLLVQPNGGNVGIGTSSPVSIAKLHVSQSSAEGTPASFSYGGAVIQNNQTSIYGTALYIIAGSAGNSSVSFGDKDASAVGEISYNHSTNSLAFSTNTTERLRIDSSGTVQFQNAVEEKQYSLTGTVIDPSNGTIQYKTLSANTTLTESLSDGEYVTLMIDDGAGYTITWPTTTWVGGSAPTLETTGYNVIELWHANGTLYGAFVGAA